jgi:peptide/nickel transport system substrate-binding protein
MRKSLLYVSYVIVVFVLLMVMPNLIISAQELPAGIQRSETLIVDSIHGRMAAPTRTNIWRVGDKLGSGLHNLVADALWYIDHGTGKPINALAAGPADYAPDYKSFTVKLREGIYWSDGVEFTAEDVAFTLEYMKAHEGLNWHPDCKKWVEEAVAKDKYTVAIKLTRPNPRFHNILTCDIWSGLYIMPKHVFEKVEDPLKFDFFKPVSLGPYVFKDYDPEGFWVLFERREDWERTSVGIVAGEPRPKYIWFVHYGPEEKRIIAQIRHEIDWIFDTTTEGWYVLKQKSEYSKSWFKDFPWAYFHDPTARGIWFNCMKSPYDKKEVRWALALAIDMYEVMLTAYDGIQIVTATHAGQGMAHFELYHKGMLEWLKEFAFPDGYKPFDPTIPYRLADYAEMKGYTVPGEPVDIWGEGWWKYDPFKAAEMLEAQGFSKGADGKWYLPDGNLWIITLTTPTYEIDATRLAFTVAEQWRKFGIDVTINTLESAPFWSDLQTGEFEVGTYWSSSAQGGIIDDLWYTHKWWHKDNIKPLGEVSVLNTVRWANDRVSALLDELSVMHPVDPKARELSYKVLKELIREMPIVPTVDCKKFSPYDTYYWKNFPSGENPYWSCLFWCGGFKWITPHLEPTGR